MPIPFPTTFGTLPKLGLAGMEERARLLGGNLRLLSELGKGTSIEVEIPV